MQQFTVPQFIDVEDKIIGPITARQFIIMLSGFMIIILFYKIFDFSLFIGSGIAVFAISGTFAFLKINGMPFHFFVLNFVQTSKKAKTRVWLNKNDQVVLAEAEERRNANEYVALKKAPLSSSRLSELSLIVDTRGAYKGEEEERRPAEEARENVKTVSVEI